MPRQASSPRKSKAKSNCLMSWQRRWNPIPNLLTHFTVLRQAGRKAMSVIAVGTVFLLLVVVTLRDNEDSQASLLRWFSPAVAESRGTV